MSESPNPTPDASRPSDARIVARVGNLTYTRVGLVLLFFWLLWFDFCFTIMEGVLGPILQFRLMNELHCDPFLYKIFLSTIPAVINLVLNPVISIWSDRHRGRRGRRVPFLLYGAPIVCACLALMGFGNDIAAWLQAKYLPSVSLVTVTVWTLGILSLVFFVFNMLLGTTFYYVFNDVVPPEHFVKFLSYFRIVGTLAGMFYSYYIFPYSNVTGPLHVNLGFWRYDTEAIWYPKIILVGSAVLYTIAGTVAMLKIKEPAYPPPDPLGEGDSVFRKWAGTVKTIARECFSHKFYVLYFLTCMMDWMSYQSGDYMNPMRLDLGMDLNTLGVIGTWTGGISLVLTLLTANYGDRFRPMPLMLVSMVLLVLCSPISLLFLIPGLSSQTYLHIQIAYSLVQVPIQVVYAMASNPLAMTLLPRDRFGQFSAAQSMLRMILPQIAGGLLAGWLMHVLVNLQGEQYALRYSFVWFVLFQAAALVCYWLLYLEWKRLGGRRRFQPPPVRPWEKKPAA